MQWRPPLSARRELVGSALTVARAIGLFPPGDARMLSLLPPLGRALHDAGQWERAEEVLSEAVDIGTASGERRLAADGAVADDAPAPRGSRALFVSAGGATPRAL